MMLSAPILVIVVSLLCSAHAYKITTTIVGKETGDLYEPAGVAVDSNGNVYIADKGNNCIRKVTQSTGDLETVAGTCSTTAGYTAGNIQATSALLDTPLRVIVDSSDNLYIADSGNLLVRYIDVTSGVISDIAGGGGNIGDNVQATTASLNYPSGIVIDSSGNLYISVYDYWNGKVRLVTTSNGLITTTVSSVPYATDLAFDAAGNLYVIYQQSSAYHYTVGKIVSGVITNIYSAASNSYTKFYGIAFDSTGNLYVSSDNYVYKMFPNGTDVIVVGSENTALTYYYYSKLYGDAESYPTGDNGLASAATLIAAYGVAVDASDNLYITDSTTNRVLKIIDESECGATDISYCLAGAAPSFDSSGCTFESCSACPVGYYTNFGDSKCKKCPAGRTSYYRGTTNGVENNDIGYCLGLGNDPKPDSLVSPQGDPYEEVCGCDGYWIGMDSSVASGLLIAMMIIYEVILLSSMRTFISNGESKYLALKLIFDITLCSLDTASDLTYIASTVFARSYYLVLCLFFYVIHFPFYFLHLQKKLGPNFLIIFPAKLLSTNPYQNAASMVALVLYRVVLLVLGFFLFASKLLTIGTVYNQFVQALTLSDEHNTEFWLDVALFNQSLYEEIFLESIPQVVLQMLNWSYVSVGGDIYNSYPLLLVSVITACFTILKNIVAVIKLKRQGKKIVERVTGFEGLLINRSGKVFAVPSAEVDDSAVVASESNHVELTPSL